MYKMTTATGCHPIAVNNNNNHNTIIITYLLTPWSRVLLEKLTGFAANQEILRILWGGVVSASPNP